MCNVILTFMLLFLDNHTESRIKWMNMRDAKLLETILKSEEFKPRLKSFGIKDVGNFVYKEVEPFECRKGPRQ